ncbi:RHS repeat-associated core domain-containing protein [Vibrio sp.]|uniref:RHS repeat-associated core domain-containing protein n=1 Tax=Vibrio sp. TaxID=678 RepID=UPI00311D77E7
MMKNKSQKSSSKLPCNQSLDGSRRRFIQGSSAIIATSPLSSFVMASGQVLQPSVSSSQLANNPLGFNGERRDPVTGLYHLGNGYRVFNPRLMRFHAADSLSPFGEGGINPYSYCLGDPINMIDPTGHMSWQGGLGIGLGILGVLISIFTLGAGIAAGVALGVAAGAASAAGTAVSTAAIASTALGITSSVLGLASSATGIASSALEESNPQLSTDLGWASLGLGVGSIITGLGSGGLGRVASINQAKSFPTQASATINQRPPGLKLGGVQVNGNNIVAHGYPFNNLAKFKGANAVNGLQFGKMVNSSLGNGNAIKLTSCFSAVGGKISSAQLLSNQTGRVVHATSGFSKAMYAGRDLNKVFTPLTGVSRGASNLVGSSVSHFVRSSVQNSAYLYRSPITALQSALQLSRWRIY